MIGNQMLRMDDVGATRRFFRPHVVDSIDRQEAIIDALLSYFLHFGNEIGVSGDVDAFAIDIQNEANAFVDIVIFVACGDSLDVDAKIREALINAAAQSVFGPDYKSPITQRNKIDRIVVIMLMGDEHEVRCKVVSFPSIGIDVNDFAAICFNAKGSVPLIK